MPKKKLTVTRQKALADYIAQRRRIMEKTGRIARQTGIDRIQMEQLIGFDRNLNLEEVSTQQLKKMMSRMSEITDRNYEPLKMTKIPVSGTAVVMPQVMFEQIQKKVNDLSRLTGGAKMDWSILESQRDVTNFIKQLDDILGNFALPENGLDQFNENLYEDYRTMLEQISLSWRDAESPLAIIKAVNPKQFYDYYTENGLPDLFNLDVASSDEIKDFIDNMSEVLSNFLNQKERGS